MTTTIMGRCPLTNRLGIALATNTLASGGLRFYHIDPEVGIIAHQAAGNFDLARLGFRLLAAGFSPEKILSDLAATDRLQPWSGHIVGENYVAMVNSATREVVVQAMARAFEQNSDQELDERLLRGLEAERDAGGQPQGQRSSFLVVHDREHYPLMDLRVDAHPEPVGELRRIHALYKPYIPLYYELRPKRPDIAPSQPQWMATRGSPG